MVEIITYSLRAGEQPSDTYYREAGLLAEQVRREALTRLRPALAGRPAEPPGCLVEEQMIELLTLGVLWRTYGARAMALSETGRLWLRRLVALRDRGGWRKQAADLLRGVLITLSLLRPTRTTRSLPSLPDLARLTGWMEATGEYRAEAKRLAPWLAYWSGLSPAAYGRQITAVLAFAAWFEQRSAAALGRYTPGVERYLHAIHPTRRWHEDQIATGKPPVEYHLNMVGAELMNRAYRERFIRTERKAVLLPACMRALSGGECQAVQDAHHLRCTGCTPTCRIHQVQQMGRKHGFAVRIITHESAAFAGNELQGLGIVGVGCVSTLLSGGWKARSLGLPAQCVLLDYCGCKKHWHPTGISTDINLRQLARVLQIL